jgi:predicted RNase H-like HicB family nuclease
MWTIEVEHGNYGRWIAEVVELPGVLAYGLTLDEAISRANALAEAVIDDRRQSDESVP